MPDKVIVIKQLNILYSGALACGASWEENVVNYPSEKIWQSRDRIPRDRPTVGTTGIPTPNFEQSVLRVFLRENEWQPRFVKHKQL